MINVSITVVPDRDKRLSCAKNTTSLIRNRNGLVYQSKYNSPDKNALSIQARPKLQPVVILYRNGNISILFTFLSKLCEGVWLMRKKIIREVDYASIRRYDFNSTNIGQVLCDIRVNKTQWFKDISSFIKDSCLLCYKIGLPLSKQVYIFISWQHVTQFIFTFLS